MFAIIALIVLVVGSDAFRASKSKVASRAFEDIDDSSLLESFYEKVGNFHTECEKFTDGTKAKQCDALLETCKQKSATAVKNPTMQHQRLEELKGCFAQLISFKEATLQQHKDSLDKNIAYIKPLESLLQMLEILQNKEAMNKRFRDDTNTVHGVLDGELESLIKTDIEALRVKGAASGSVKATASPPTSTGSLKVDETPLDLKGKGRTSPIEGSDSEIEAPGTVPSAGLQVSQEAPADKTSGGWSWPWKSWQWAPWSKAAGEETKAAVQPDVPHLNEATDQQQPGETSASAIETTDEDEEQGGEVSEDGKAVDEDDTDPSEVIVDVAEGEKDDKDDVTSALLQSSQAGNLSDIYASTSAEASKSSDISELKSAEDEVEADEEDSGLLGLQDVDDAATDLQASSFLELQSETNLTTNHEDNFKERSSLLIVQTDEETTTAVSVMNASRSQEPASKELLQSSEAGSDRHR